MTIAKSKRIGAVGLEGLGLFTKLFKAGHTPADMGLIGSFGDIMRLSGRLRIAKAFRGVELEGVGVLTKRGYDALLRVFLTHSALEQYLKITDQKLAQLEEAHVLRQSAKVMARIFEDDKESKLFAFVHARLNSHLQQQFARCRDQKCLNVGVVSSAIRHIFVHGYLAANTNEVKPQRIIRTCNEVSTFLVEYMDGDFLDRMKAFARGKRI